MADAGQGQVTLTKAEAALLGRRAAKPVKAAGELLCVFVPGKLANPLNGTPWVWQKRARYARAWKERVAMAMLEDGVGMPLHIRSSDPKRVELFASLWNVMDGDGLQAAMKPVRDALTECGVISGDADRDGHRFWYSQKIDRARRGVEIRVRLR